MATEDVEAPTSEDYARIAQLVEDYADFPLGAVDASVIALAERLDTATVITVDRRHFTTPSARPIARRSSCCRSSQGHPLPVSIAPFGNFLDLQWNARSITLAASYERGGPSRLVPHQPHRARFGAPPVTGMDDFDPIREPRVDVEELSSPAALNLLERHTWLELWRAPSVEAVEGEGFESRFYGPLHAHAIASAPQVPLLNVVLGAAEPGAVEEGHLAEALEWTESLDLDCRVLVRPDCEDSGAAEDQLNRRGYRRTAFLVRYLRDVSPPGFPEPPGIEVDEWTDPTEGFSEYFAEGFDLGFPEDHVFDCLPGRRPWRCYVAVDEHEEGAGAALTAMHFQVAQLAFAATKATARGRGVHMALLRRRILDAAAAGARLLFADAEEPLDDPDGPSRATRNLLRAGFKQVSAQPVWRPPQ
jgi:hypothetical protein